MRRIYKLLMTIILFLAVQLVLLSLQVDRIDTNSDDDYYQEQSLRKQHHRRKKYNNWISPTDVKLMAGRRPHVEYEDYEDKNDAYLEYVRYWEAVDAIVDVTNKRIRHNGFYQKAEDCQGKFTEPELLGAYEKIPDELCDVYEKEAAISSRDIVTNVIRPTYSDPPDDVLRAGVTLVTQLSGDRLATLEKIVKHWEGDISVCVYVASIDNLRLKWTSNPVFSSRSNIAVHAVRQGPEMFYPVNVLRNVALNQSLTQYVFLTDGDLVPSFNMARDVMQFLPETDKKQAFVVPAFEISSESTLQTYPRNKSEVVERWKRGDMAQFKVENYKVGHDATKYNKWQHRTNTTYKVKYHSGYEPYVIIPKALAPRYHEKFIGFFLNKVSFLVELFAAGFEFVVLPNVFTVHLPHPNGAVQLKDHKECVQHIFADFLHLLEEKYCIRFTPYAFDCRLFKDIRYKHVE